MAKPIAPALRALLEHLIDYAGMFPPAMLPREEAMFNYKNYRGGVHAWMLRWLVVNGNEMELIPREFDSQMAVLCGEDNSRAAVLETKAIVTAKHPAYCEVPISDLDSVKAAGCFAKLRTGSVKPEGIPSVADVAAFIVACAERRLSFKATAGLHHPVRAMHPLTYEANAPRATMHGFLNVFLAASFAWHGQRDIEPILAETDATAFQFDNRAHWRGWSLDETQVRVARHQFAHSFGSCSFEEPVQDLQALGLL